MDKLTAFTSEQLKETVPAFEIGDTVKVYNKIIEGTRENSDFRGYGYFKARRRDLGILYRSSCSLRLRS